jgi:hypothetical protein
VAAIAAPAAQAVVLDEGGTVPSENTRSAFVTRGNHETFAAVPAEGAIMLRGDDKVIQPTPQRIVAGAYGVLPPLPSDRFVEPGDYGVLPAADAVRPTPVGRPGIDVAGHRGTLEWSDALIGGIAGLGLVLAGLLAFGAARSTRRGRRPATA